MAEGGITGMNPMGGGECREGGAFMYGPHTQYFFPTGIIFEVLT